MKNSNKSYSIKSLYLRFFRIIIIAIVSYHWFTTILSASGGYDNGTATGKGKLGLDLTWNPFNYFPEGQSYIVLSYGFTTKFDFHSYYSHPVKGNDNYYFGFFYQLYKNKYLDLATAVGIRQYRPKSQRHMFAPQLLYTFYGFRNLRVGGSLVALRDFDRNNKLLGTTLDIALIIPLFKSGSIDGKVNSLDFCIGAFKPVLWAPAHGEWYPTYSFDIKFTL